jgi:hypothetical protein
MTPRHRGRVRSRLTRFDCRTYDLVHPADQPEPVGAGIDRVYVFPAQSNMLSSCRQLQGERRRLKILLVTSGSGASCVPRKPPPCHKGRTGSGTRTWRWRWKNGLHGVDVLAGVWGKQKGGRYCLLLCLPPLPCLCENQREGTCTVSIALAPLLHQADPWRASHAFTRRSTRLDLAVADSCRCERPDARMWIVWIWFSECFSDALML